MASNGLVGQGDHSGWLADLSPAANHLTSITVPAPGLPTRGRNDSGEQGADLSQRPGTERAVGKLRAGQRIQAGDQGADARDGSR